MYDAVCGVANATDLLLLSPLYCVGLGLGAFGVLKLNLIYLTAC